MEVYYAFVKKLANAFDMKGLDYAFTGALATSFYGVPRTTSDVDVIVAVTDSANVKDKIVWLWRVTATGLCVYTCMLHSFISKF